MTKTGYLGRSRKVEENNIGHVIRKDDGDPVTSAPLFFVSKQVEYTATPVSVLVSVQYIHTLYPYTIVHYLPRSGLTQERETIVADPNNRLIHFRLQVMPYDCNITAAG